MSTSNNENDNLTKIENKENQNIIIDNPQTTIIKQVNQTNTQQQTRTRTKEQTQE